MSINNTTTSNGILSLTEEQYRASEAISKSDLDWIAPPRTPAHYKAKKDGLLFQPATAAMRLGSLIHRAVLEPDTMHNAFVTKPEGPEGDARTKEGKAWRQTIGDRAVLTHEEGAQLRDMVDAVWSHPLAKRILKDAQTEVCLFAEDSNGMARKGRLDALVKGNVVPDLKTTASADASEFEKSIGKYRYHVQAAYYVDLCKLIGIDKTDFVFICVEKEPPYAVAVYSLDQDALQLGRMEYQRDLMAVQQCMESGKWPSFAEEVRVIGLPLWMRKQVEGLV